MKAFSRFLCISVFAVMLAGSASAITWVPEDFNCPLDKQKNTFLVVASYGSYIYAYPSKYQWLFFPRTDSPTFYLCKKCNLATFMWDFDKLPPEKLDAIRKALAGVKVSKEFKEYTEIPVVERLEIMEKVYAALGKDDAWWEDFYRLKGYHYGKIGETAKAAEARKKSLALIQKDLANPKSETPKKIMFYVSASMKHFLGDDKGAIADLNTALLTKYANAKETAEESKGAEAGLNERINDYITRINSEKNKPRLFDKYSSDEH